MIQPKWVLLNATFLFIYCGTTPCSEEGRTAIPDSDSSPPQFNWVIRNKRTGKEDPVANPKGYLYRIKRGERFDLLLKAKDSESGVSQLSVACTNMFCDNSPIENTLSTFTQEKRNNKETCVPVAVDISLADIPTELNIACRTVMLQFEGKAANFRGRESTSVLKVAVGD